MNSDITASHPDLYFHQLPPQAVTEDGSTRGNEATNRTLNFLNHESQTHQDSSDMAGYPA